MKSVSSNTSGNTNTATTANTTSAASSPAKKTSSSVLTIPSNSTVTSLESKLKLLKDQGNEYNALLTQKLASSQSGQNLLHIGTSLSSLPPDLHMMITSLHPVLVQIENLEKQQYTNLTQLFVNQANAIQYEIKKFIHTKECAEYYQDLVVAEQRIQVDKSNKQTKKKQQQQQQQQQQKEAESNDGDVVATAASMDSTNKNTNEEEEKEEELLDALDHLASLERAAHTTLTLVHDLQLSSAQINSVLQTKVVVEDPEKKTGDDSNTGSANSAKYQQQSQPDTERAQFLMKLSPRIRRLESDTIQSLTYHMDLLLKEFQSHRLDNSSSIAAASNKRKEDLLLLMLGHVMRGLTLLGRGKEVESIFARVAIMPLIRSKVSMGRLDEGGSRGECVGLSSLLDEIITSIAQIFGPVLVMSESMFQITLEDTTSAANSTSGTAMNMDVDLITEGVWIPIVTTFMAADTGIKMAIFSPGIANILQRNYIVLDTFLNQLSKRLLHQEHPQNNSAEGNAIQESKEEQNAPSNEIAQEGKESTVEDQLTSTINDNNKALKDLYKDYSYDYYYYHHHIYETKEKDDNKTNGTSEIIKTMTLRAQSRIYAHKKTIDFYKKWNLPIYYQLRFGECCNRLNIIINSIQKDGWLTQVVEEGAENNNKIDTTGLVSSFELPFFIEFYDILATFWKSQVFLKPLTNRFLRGSMQLIGRTLAFIKESMEGKIMFGVDPAETAKAATTTTKEPGAADSSVVTADVPVMSSTRSSYCWGDSEADVGAVAWELTVLKMFLTSHFVDLICKAITEFSSHETNGEDQQKEQKELRIIIVDTLKEVCDQQVSPIIDTAWNEVIVKILISKCSQPLAAVKGVAATYRMTNRPPPIHPSPFVTTILRPLHDFDKDFQGKAPSSAPSSSTFNKWWKYQIIATVADRYSIAVEELLATVQRTEVALKNRKTALRTIRSVGGMTDGEKVKLQVYLDFQEFLKNAQTILGSTEGDSAANKIPGMEKLRKLTIEGESLLQRLKNKK